MSTQQVIAPPSGVKHCHRCGETKPRSEFYRDRSKRTGLSSACKPCCAEKRDEWRAKNPERHREVYLAEAKRHYRNNREYHSAKARRRNAALRDRIWIVDWVRRCRGRGLETDRETREYAELIFNEPCTFCGTRPAYGIDHIEPISKGGEHHWTNLAAACSNCNGAKQTRTLLAALPVLERRTA